MSDRDPWDAIGASLREQFEPPSLEALADEVDRIAVQTATDARESEEAANARPSSSAQWSRAGVLVAVAAAVVLVWWLGRAPAVVPTDEPEPHVPRIAMGSEQVAGSQLHEFLRTGQALPPVDVNCSVIEAPPDCQADGPQPFLEEGLAVSVLGECGGLTGIDCAGYALPAQRALHVRLQDSGADVIVCIEPPWADPHPELPPGSDYNIFRRTIGEFILYEVTPLAEPVALDHITL